MGLRRLRNRLDQLQGNANFTVQEARALLDDVGDGVGVKLVIDPVFLDKLREALKGSPFLKVIDRDGTLLTTFIEFAKDIPITLVVDPTVDA